MERLLWENKCSYLSIMFTKVIFLLGDTKEEVFSTLLKKVVSWLYYLSLSFKELSFWFTFSLLIWTGPYLKEAVKSSKTKFKPIISIWGTTDCGETFLEVLSFEQIWWHLFFMISFTSVKLKRYFFAQGEPSKVIAVIIIIAKKAKNKSCCH